MKRIKHYLEDTITQMLFDAVIAFWEQPLPEKEVKEEMHTLLESVERKLEDKIKQDNRFVGKE